MFIFTIKALLLVVFKGNIANLDPGQLIDGKVVIWGNHFSNFHTGRCNLSQRVVIFTVLPVNKQFYVTLMGSLVFCG